MYFALEESPEIGALIINKRQDYLQAVRSLNLVELWERSYFQYYRGYYTRGGIEFHGKQSEFRTISINHYRNLLQHIYQMTTSQPAAFEPLALNADYESTSQVRLARNLLDYTMETKGVEEYMKRAAEYAIFFGEGFLIDEWDEEVGDVILEDEEGNAQKAGDIVYENAGPWDVARDTGMRSFHDLDWMIVTTYRNKYTLASRFPEQKKVIEDISWAPEKDDLILHQKFHMDTDVIPVHTLYHKKTPALPNGRIVRVLEPNIIIQDTPIPYDNFPVKRVSPNEMYVLPFGYSIGFDLLAPQKMKDMLESTIATNQDMFGVQSITVPVGSNIAPEVLMDGLNVVYYDANEPPPAPLNLLSTPQEIFAKASDIVSEMEVLSAVNSVMRGNPKSNIRSGNQAALIQSMGAQFNSHYQASYQTFQEKIANSILDIYKSFAKEERTMEIVGESGRIDLVNFSKESLTKVKKIKAKVVDPLLKTITGKQAVASEMLERGLIKAPEQYIQMRETGRIEPVVKRDQAEADLIQKENEELLKIQLPQGLDPEEEQAVLETMVPPVMVTDAHVLHIMEQTVNLASPESRANPDIAKATLFHINKHIEALATVSPALLQILGQPSLQAPPPEGGEAPKEESKGVDNQTPATPPPQMPAPA